MRFSTRFSLATWHSPVAVAGLASLVSTETERRNLASGDRTPARRFGAVEEQLLFGAVVDPVGAPTLTVQEAPDPRAFHAPDHTLMQN